MPLRLLNHSSVRDSMLLIRCFLARAARAGSTLARGSNLASRMLASANMCGIAIATRSAPGSQWPERASRKSRKLLAIRRSPCRPDTATYLPSINCQWWNASHPDLNRLQNHMPDILKPRTLRAGAMKRAISCGSVAFCSRRCLRVLQLLQNLRGICAEKKSLPHRRFAHKRTCHSLGSVKTLSCTTFFFSNSCSVRSVASSNILHFP